MYHSPPGSKYSMYFYVGLCKTDSLTAFVNTMIFKTLARANNENMKAHHRWPFKGTPSMVYTLV